MMSDGTQPPEEPSLSATKRRLAVILVHTWAPQADAIDYGDVCSRALGPDFEVREVRATGFAAVRQAAENAVKAGAWLIVSVGGDGTARAIADGIGTTTTRLIVLPGGTGNDLSYCLGQGNDPRTVAPMIGQFEEVQIDAMRVNGHRFILAATLGFVSELSSFLNRLRSKEGVVKKTIVSLGKGFFFFAFLWVALRHRKLGGHLEISYRDLKDGQIKTRELDALNFQIVSYPSAARGDYPMLSHSDFADGKYEIIIWPRLTHSRFQKLLAGMKTGEYLKMPEIICLQTDYCEVKCNQPMLCFTDGEPIPLQSSYKFEIEPRAIQMMAPKGLRPGSRLLSTRSA